MSPPKPLSILAFALVTFTILALQIVLSRLFGGTMSYYYAFMLVSLAMLGLASGGLLVEIFPHRFPVARLWPQASILSLAMGASISIGTLAVLKLSVLLYTGRPEGTATLDAPAMAVIFWCIFPPFLFGGLVVSLVLSHAREHFHRLYAWDLMAAAAGCIVAVVLLVAGTPTEALLKVLAVLPLAAAAAFAVSGGRPKLALGALAATVGFALLGLWAVRDPDVARPPHLHRLGWATVVNEWNAVSCVRVHPDRFLDWSLSGRYRGPAFPMAALLIDGFGGTQIVGFDGDPRSLARYEYLDYDLPALGQRLSPPSQSELVIGPGGGIDLLQAVRRGRSDITAVEINPLVVRVVNEDMGSFSGRPYYLPGVTVRIDNGRTFIERTDRTWGLIALTWVDTGGSATALALSENYLYTVEAFEGYLRHLKPDGFIGFLRALGAHEAVRVDSLRGVAVAVEALARLGIADPGRHLLAAASASPYFRRPMCYVLVKRSPFTAEEVESARRFLAERGFQPLWFPDGSPDPASLPPPFAEFAGVIHGTITAGNRAAYYREAAFDVTPTTDDNPFYFVERGGPNRSAGRGLRALGIYLLILGSLVVPFLGLPTLPLLRRTGRLGIGGVAALAYFSLLGIAFMLVEIELFQVFALVVGSPTVTLATVLASLLLASGVGSLFGKRLGSSRPGWLAGHFAVLAGLLLAFILTKEALLRALVVQPLPLRILGTVAVILPIGLAMGVPMPAGMRQVRARADVVLWGWALNGALSVLASVAAVFLAIYVGIGRTFLLGTACYLAAGALLLLLATHPVPEPEPPAAAG